MERRRRVAILVAGVMSILIVGASVLGRGLVAWDSPGVEAPAPATKGFVPVSADTPCAKILNGLGTGASRDAFLESGFASLSVPDALLARYRLGSYTCLEDLLLHRVEAVVVSISDSEGTTVGYWLVRPLDDRLVGSLPHDPRVVLEPTDWSEYLTRLAETDLVIVDREPALLGARPGPAQQDLASIAPSGGATTPLWDALLAAKSSTAP